MVLELIRSNENCFNQELKNCLQPAKAVIPFLSFADNFSKCVDNFEIGHKTYAKLWSGV